MWYTMYMIAIVPIIILVLLIGVCWHAYISHSIKNHGVDTIATVIRKYNGTLEYDVLFEGEYYINTIDVSKKVYREVTLGEHYNNSRPLCIYTGRYD